MQSTSTLLKGDHLKGKTLGRWDAWVLLNSPTNTPSEFAPGERVLLHRAMRKLDELGLVKNRKVEEYRVARDWRTGKPYSFLSKTQTTELTKLGEAVKMQFADELHAKKPRIRLDNFRPISESLVQDPKPYVPKGKPTEKELSSWEESLPRLSKKEQFERSHSRKATLFYNAVDTFRQKWDEPFDVMPIRTDEPNLLAASIYAGLIDMRDHDVLDEEEVEDVASTLVGLFCGDKWVPHNMLLKYVDEGAGEDGESVVDVWRSFDADTRKSMRHALLRIVHPDLGGKLEDSVKMNKLIELLDPKVQK